MRLIEFHVRLHFKVGLFRITWCFMRLKISTVMFRLSLKIGRLFFSLLSNNLWCLKQLTDI